MWGRNWIYVEYSLKLFQFVMQDSPAELFLHEIATKMKGLQIL